MGFIGVLIPEAYGGLDYGLMGAGIISWEMGRTLVASPMLSTAIIGAHLISKGASIERREKLLPEMVAGKSITALALDEGGRFGPDNISLYAVSSKDGYILNGDKIFVLDGMAADTFIVAARTSVQNKEGSGLTLFLVDAKSKGVSIKRQVLVDSRGAANVGFEDVLVGKDDIIGDVDRGDNLLGQALNIANLCLSAELLGLSESVFSQTLDFLKARTQFGVAIGSFQSLQHRASELFSEIELGKSVLLSGLSAADDGFEGLDYPTSLAKAKLSGIARLATNEAVQMHGGMGMTDEFDIGFYMKRARAISLIFGDPSWHLDRFARSKGY
jgi:alkylation response protein AidB-like acyl-CoA dehydrogenase